MKFILFIVFSISNCFSWSQSIYCAISGGYQFNSKYDQSPSYLVNSVHQIVLPWFWRPESYSFKNTLYANLSFGHLITKNVGYELSGGYLKPMNVTDHSEIIKRSVSGDFIEISAKLVLSIPFNKFDIYTKLGLHSVNGKISYSQTAEIPSSSSFGVDKTTLKYEYKGPMTLGFYGAFGMDLKIFKKISFFSEISFLSQIFSPKKGEQIEYTTNGVNQASNPKPYYSQIEFGDESEWNHWSSEDISQPQKLTKRNYSLGGYRITVGLKFLLWSKMENKSDLIE